MTTIFDKQILPEAADAADRAFREVILARVPAIQKLESLESLVGLNLISVERTALEMVNLKYSATAPNIYPRIRKELLEKGVVKKHNFFDHGELNKGCPSEYVREVFRFYGSRLWVYLTVYKNEQPKTS